MQNLIPLAFGLISIIPAVAWAQEPSGLPKGVWEERDPSILWTGSGGVSLMAAERIPAPRELWEDRSSSDLTVRGAQFNLVQDEISPNLHFGLAVYLRADFPGDTAVDSSNNVAYSDIFDVGYGLNVEANLLSWITPHLAIGGYLSVGWDRFAGASDVDMGTGEFFTFDDQDTVTVILGGKVLQKFAPFWFWEGRMGVGMVHYGELTFSDVTLPIADTGLQFFRPVTHGLFELGGRVGVGNQRVTFDLGLDFRFMGAEARGRDVTNVVSPDLFFVFAIDLGLSMRF